MGGRGSNSKIRHRASTQMQAQAQPIPAPPQPQPQPVQQNPIADQVPDDNNTPVTPDPLAMLAGMDDGQLAQLFKDSQKAQLPNHLNDVSDITQKFIFQIGMNDKPTVLDQTEFNQFLADNNIPRSQILARSFNGSSLKTSSGRSTKLTPQDIADMLKYSRLNYIGGKKGGQAYGAGTYLAMTGGRNTGYGGVTVNAVLNPKTAKVISDTRLATLARQFDRTHPQFARATGGYNSSFHNNNMSVYAVVLGYNVISDGSNTSGAYRNVIDRKALVYLK